MDFAVPQFIEKEPKIVGPFTFRQFVFIGIAGGVCIALYFLVSFATFLIITIILVGGAFGLAFLKVGIASLPAFIKNLFIFLLKPKIYLWKKKGIPPKVFRKEKKPEEKETTPKVIEGSRLRELITRLETKLRW